MSRIRLRALASAAGLVLLVGVLTATSAGGWFGPSRDEDGFRVYVTGAYGRTSGSEVSSLDADYAWAIKHPEEVLAEGDRACDWLENQPDPPKSSREHEVHALAVRYLRSARIERRIPHGRRGQQTVVLGAWALLCGRTRDAKRSPFRGGD